MFSDLWHFLKSITFIDYIFFFTVIFLIILVVSLIYFIKINEEVLVNDDIKDSDDLKKIASSLKNKEVKPITFTSYEKEQEDKAIISYDELLSNTGEFKLNYEDEKQLGDLAIKKVDLNNLFDNKTLETSPKVEVHLFSLKKEEEFLKTLKELYSKLN